MRLRRETPPGTNRLGDILLGYLATAGSADSNTLDILKSQVNPSVFCPIVVVRNSVRHSASFITLTLLTPRQLGGWSMSTGCSQPRMRADPRPACCVCDYVFGRGDDLPAIWVRVSPPPTMPCVAGWALPRLLQVTSRRP